MIYIDLGCHNGDSIIDFYEGKFGSYSKEFIESRDIRAIGIDPLSNYEKELSEISNEYGTKIIKAVVSNYSGKATLSEHPKTDISSSIRPEKPNYDNGIFYEVDCIRFSDFIKDYDDVLVRMDIEGEEYNVLDDLIETGEIKRIKYIEIEFHAHRLQKKHMSKYYKRGGDIIAKLDELKVNYKLI